MGLNFVTKTFSEADLQKLPGYDPKQQHSAVLDSGVVLEANGQMRVVYLLKKEIHDQALKRFDMPVFRPDLRKFTNG